MTEITFSEHVLFEIEHRSINKKEIERLVQSPEQESPARKGRIVLQGKYYDSKERKLMLLRIIGIRTGNNFYVITAYKTSKIAKYWKGEV